MSGILKKANGLCGWYRFWIFRNFSGETINGPYHDSLPKTVNQYDYLLRSLQGTNFSIDYRFQNVPIPNSSFEGNSSITLSVAPDDSFNPSLTHDETYYGSSIHNISSLAHVLVSGKFPTLPPPLNESFLRHTTFSGTGFVPRDPLNLDPYKYYVSDAVLFGTTSDVSQSYRLLKAGVTYRQSSLGELHLPEYYPYLGYLDLDSWLDALCDSSPVTSGIGVQPWRMSSYFKNLSSDATKRVVRCITYIDWSGPYLGESDVSYSWSYDLTLRYDRTTSLREDSPSNVYWVLDKHPLEFAFKSATSTLPYDLTFPVLEDQFLRSDQIGYFVESTDLPNRNPRVLLPDERGYLPVKTYWHTYRNFATSVSNAYKEIVPSALFSCVDAVNSIEAGTSTDVLQSLYKLPQYESMIPKLREAVDILSDIYHKDVNLSTLGDIMKLLSATTLQGSFQWRPALQLLSTELPKIVALIQGLQSKKARNLVVGRGKFNFEFKPSAFGRQTSRLLTRSKIVLDVSERSLVSCFLGWDGLGIWPKPSTLWDLVPFSFVANWFTGIGASIKRAEYATLLLDVPAYFVHTYAITSPFTDDELDTWEMSNASSKDPLSFRAYYRDVSHYSPLPRDSSFGFGLPQHLPPLGVVGALLYQILF